MGKALCLVINRTGQDIKFTTWRVGYVEELKHKARHIYHELTIESGKHYAFSASEFEKLWVRIQKVTKLCPQWTVSLRSQDQDGIPLPVSEQKDNRAFVFEMGADNELVKLTVSREEAKRAGIKKRIFGSLEKMESQLISLVNKRKTASSSVRQE